GPNRRDCRISAAACQCAARQADWPGARATGTTGPAATTAHSEMPGELIVTAANGGRWKRDPGATSTPAQLFAAGQLLTGDWHQRQWIWWRDGQIEAEEGKARAVLHEWDHAEPPPGGYQYGGSTEEAVAAMEAEWDAQRAERERARLARQERFDEE